MSQSSEISGIFDLIAIVIPVEGFVRPLKMLLNDAGLMPKNSANVF